MDNNSYLPPYDVFEEDPLINFVCLNPLCTDEFEPDIIINPAEKKIFFTCPYCETKYEAEIEFIEIAEKLKIFTVINGPHIIELGKKVVSS